MYHFSMYHASHHIVPVPATDAEVSKCLMCPPLLLSHIILKMYGKIPLPPVLQIEAEANAVRAVAETVCPLNIVLDRVVLTSTGVLLGCWQVSFIVPDIFYGVCSPGLSLLIITELQYGNSASMVDLF